MTSVGFPHANQKVERAKSTHEPSQVFERCLAESCRVEGAPGTINSQPRASQYLNIVFLQSAKYARIMQWQAGQQTWSCGTVDQSLTSELLNVIVVPINFINRQEDGIEYLIIEDCDENPYTGIRTTSSSRKITFHEHTFSFGGVHEVRHRHGVPFEEK